MKVFISHIVEEKDLAVLLKEHIGEDFLGKVECFVSSDTESVLAGQNWLASVEEALKNASVEVILCSPTSVKRPWINFEAGAGWMRGIPIVPICHTGLTPRNLPLPMTVLQAISASEPTGLRALYTTIANAHQSRVPPLLMRWLLRSLSSRRPMNRGCLEVSPRTPNEIASSYCE